MGDLFGSWRSLIRQGTEEAKKELVHKLELVCNYLDRTQGCSQENAIRIQKLRLSVETLELEPLLNEIEALLSETKHQKVTEELLRSSPNSKAPREENKNISEEPSQRKSLTSLMSSSNKNDETIEIFVVTIEPIQSLNGEYRYRSMQVNYEISFYGAVQDNKPPLKEFKIELFDHQKDCVRITMLRGVSRRCFIEINRSMMLIQKQTIQLSQSVWFTIEEMSIGYIDVKLNTAEKPIRFKRTFSIGRMGTWLIDDASLEDEHVSITCDDRASEWKIQNIHSAKSSIILHVPDANRLWRDSAPAWIYDGTIIRIDEAILKVNINSFPEK